MHEFCAKSVGVTNYYSSLFTNGFTAAEVTIGELAKGKGLLVRLSIIVKRDLMRHIYCVLIGEANYLWLVLTNEFTATVVAIGELARGNYANLGVISKFHHD